MKMRFMCLFFLFPVFIFSADCQKHNSSNTGSVKLTFRNMINGHPMVLDDSTYTNPFGETYSITKFKYYVSNISVSSIGGQATEKESYHLVDQRIPGSLSFSFEASENNFTGLHFLLGVDSIRNVSGAQTGALDPLNDMFWTWNNGYVMAKMEGSSPQSGQAGNKIEYHIAGFSGINNVLKEINLVLPAGKTLAVKQGSTSELIIEADFNDWWQSPNDIKIADMQICTTVGVMAKKIADNYSKMFTITSVVNN